jgi:hypothetical protein
MRAAYAEVAWENLGFALDHAHPGLYCEAAVASAKKVIKYMARVYSALKLLLPGDTNVEAEWARLSELEALRKADVADLAPFQKYMRSLVGTADEVSADDFYAAAKRAISAVDEMVKAAYEPLTVGGGAGESRPRSRVVNAVAAAAGLLLATALSALPR